MTPEQLEELPGVGPKTVEKISLAVNNYYSSLESAQPAAGESAAKDEAAAGEATPLPAEAGETAEAASGGESAEEQPSQATEETPSQDGSREGDS
jgi:N utilization substance protein A